RPILLPSGAINTFSRSDRPRAVTERPRSILPKRSSRTGSTRNLRICVSRCSGKTALSVLRLATVSVPAQKISAINLIFDEGYDQFMTDMTPLVQKLKDAKPDVLVVISFINDTVLLHRKAKELDFNVPALIGVSAGHSVPDLKNSISTAVNGLFVSDLPVLVNPNALRPDVQAAAEEFNKRYEKVQRRVPAGHAVASFAALWT